MGKHREVKERKPLLSIEQTIAIVLMIGVGGIALLLYGVTSIN